MFVDSQLIKKVATGVGFDACGISDANVDDMTISALKTWIAAEHNAGMLYMEHNIDVRSNLNLLVEDAKSVISVLYSYNTEEKLIGCFQIFPKFKMISNKI